MKIASMWLMFFVVCSLPVLAQQNQITQNNTFKTPSSCESISPNNVYIAIDYGILFKNIQSNESLETIDKKLKRIEKSKASKRERVKKDKTTEHQRIKLLDDKKEELLKEKEQISLNMDNSVK